MKLNEIFVCLFLIISVSHSGTDLINQNIKIDDILNGDNFKLAKKSATTLSSYKNDAFNFSFNAPKGWTFSTPQVLPDKIMIECKNPLYKPTITVGVMKKDTEHTADMGSGYECFSFLNRIFNYDPLIPINIIFSMDTIVSPGAGLKWLVLSFGTNLSLFGVTLNKFFGNFYYTTTYLTTSLDNDENKEIYASFDDSIKIIQNNSLAKVRHTYVNDIKLTDEYFNLLGKRGNVNERHTSTNLLIKYNGFYFEKFLKAVR